MTDDSTLGGYFRVHQRPPAFEGVDGQAYSVAIYVDDEPDPEGRYGGALLFIRWSPGGESPVGHLETEYLVYGTTAPECDERIRALPLLDVKQHLDRLISQAASTPSW